jgi:hypothetical protein
MASSSGLTREVIDARYSGKIKVYIQGDIWDRIGKVVFVTVHDVGSNHRAFLPFVASSHMTEVRKKTIWIHVCLPGQDDKEVNLPEGYEYPELDKLAHDILYILEAFNVRTVMLFGEGVGANILCRFALYYPNRCMGAILLDCTSGTAGVDEYLRNTVFNWSEGGSKVVSKVMKFITFHKKETGRGEAWKGRLNPYNLGKLLDKFLKRTDISQLISRDLKYQYLQIDGRVESLLVNGSTAPNVGSCYAINKMRPECTTVVIVDRVCDVITEAPRNLARSLILFSKGCGLLLGVPMLGLEKEFERLKMSGSASKTQIAIANQLLDNERRRGRKDITE